MSKSRQVPQELPGDSGVDSQPGGSSVDGQRSHRERGGRFVQRGQLRGDCRGADPHLQGRPAPHGAPPRALGTSPATLFPASGPSSSALDPSSEVLSLRQDPGALCQPPCLVLEPVAQFL